MVYIIDIILRRIQGDCFLQSYTSLKCFCEIFLFLLITFIIVTSFVWGQHCVFVIAIVMGECAILILQKITVWCMSLLLLYIDIQWFCSFIMIYFQMVNGAMVKWWVVKWYNGEIKKRIGRFVSHNYRICSFVLFLNTFFLK